MIATTMNDAFETADAVLDDIDSGNIREPEVDEDITDYIRKHSGTAGKQQIFVQYEITFYLDQFRCL